MNIDNMQETAGQVSELMKVLSNPVRLILLCQLVEGEKSVGQLAGLLDLRDAAVSQQLALLRKDGLVANRRDGQTIFYSLARGDIEALIRFLYRTYCEGPEE